VLADYQRVLNGYLTWRLQMNRKIDRTVHPRRILRKTYGTVKRHLVDPLSTIW
jgi:hypothetical protein